jgi:hypothetical protein
MSASNGPELPPVMVMTASGFENLTKMRIRDLQAKGIRYVVVDLENVFGGR